jgi:heme exporter protein C
MKSKPFTFVYWTAALLALVGALAMLLTYTPTEETMGQIQKIFYLHLPLAINTFLAALVVCIASVGYLFQKHTFWDDLAYAAAKITLILATGVLATGMIWGHSAWGTWWTWSPRLTFSLMLWLLYAVYLVVRSSIESPQRRAVVCAVYGLTAFLDVPIVYLSSKLLPDVHPSSIQLIHSMKLTLLVWFVPVTMIAAGLVAARFSLNRAQRRRDLERREKSSRPVPQVRLGANGRRAPGGLA